MGGTHFCGGGMFVLAKSGADVLGFGVPCGNTFGVSGEMRGPGCRFWDAVVGCRDGPVWDGELVPCEIYFLREWGDIPWLSRFCVPAVRGN
jgi:hypothetical protein